MMDSDPSHDRLVALLRLWESRSDATDKRMRDLIGGFWYSSLSDEQRKQYCVLQAEYTATRTCANEMAELLGVEQRHARRGV